MSNVVASIPCHLLIYYVYPPKIVLVVHWIFLYLEEVGVVIKITVIFAVISIFGLSSHIGVHSCRFWTIECHICIFCCWLVCGVFYFFEVVIVVGLHSCDGSMVVSASRVDDYGGIVIIKSFCSLTVHTSILGGVHQMHHYRYPTIVIGTIPAFNMRRWVRLYWEILLIILAL